MGTSGYEHRRGVKEKDHGQARGSPPRRREERGPEQRVPQAKERLRQHQIEGPSQSVVTGQRSDVGGFQSEAVEDERDQEAEQVGPVPAIQNRP